MEDKKDVEARPADSGSSRGGSGGPADERVYPGAPVSGGSGSGSTESAGWERAPPGPAGPAGGLARARDRQRGVFRRGPGRRRRQPRALRDRPGRFELRCPEGGGGCSRRGCDAGRRFREGPSADAPVVHADARAAPLPRAIRRRVLPATKLPARLQASRRAGQTDAQAPATVTVRVVVDSSAVGGSVSADTTLSFDPGVSAYDALCGTALPVNARDSGFGVYVAAIGGLAEKEHGGESGWKYSVNGTSRGTPRAATSSRTATSSSGCTSPRPSARLVGAQELRREKKLYQVTRKVEMKAHRLVTDVQQADANEHVEVVQA